MIDDATTRVIQARPPIIVRSLSLFLSFVVPTHADLTDDKKNDFIIHANKRSLVPVVVVFFFFFFSTRNKDRRRKRETI